MEEVSRSLVLEELLKAIFRTTISMVMDEVSPQMEIAMKDSLTIMTCMDMASILIWKTINDMKVFGNEEKSQGYFEFMIE